VVTDGPTPGLSATRTRCERFTFPLLLPALTDGNADHIPDPFKKCQRGACSTFLCLDGLTGQDSSRRGLEAEGETGAA
jgi:hypothetical protein